MPERSIELRRPIPATRRDRHLTHAIHVADRSTKCWVRNLHDAPSPVGLFIPFKSAWLAVKEFIETDGALPKSIEWVANKDLPDGTFPDPGSPHLGAQK